MNILDNGSTSAIVAPSSSGATSELFVKGYAPNNPYKGTESYSSSSNSTSESGSNDVTTTRPSSSNSESTDENNDTSENNSTTTGTGTTGNDSNSNSNENNQGNTNSNNNNTGNTGNSNGNNSTGNNGGGTTGNDNNSNGSSNGGGTTGGDTGSKVELLKVVPQLPRAVLLHLNKQIKNIKIEISILMFFYISASFSSFNLSQSMINWQTSFSGANFIEYLRPYSIIV
ncbi:hypothetical protein [Companilactobacillus nodensis]|uniref:hypothetical protein n=1 Tax=Companilactobacillus nodensis TaxID=460870 RepID=UPI001F2AD0C6|nr:hypothetical protein [Companilactobacillus nodensis]